jgi:asparagine synthase (glutamine-hydrolysing)
MCGIDAIYAYRPDAAAVDASELDRITQFMFRRGPDAGGTWISSDGRVGLGSRRLAIIDLHPEATQPMHSASSELTIVFNGEIYNYRELRQRLEASGAQFTTSSDTEVLLHLYRRDGERMTELLRGMYAFTIWDARDRRLFVARDPYGIKPLYYSDHDGTFRAASQVKALLAGGHIPRTPDFAGRASFLLTGSVLEPFTSFASIRAVEAGTSFFVSESGRTEPRRHFSIAATLKKALEQQSIARLTTPDIFVTEFVRESVGYHLVADVPVGVFLSAGIDSTAIAFHAARATTTPLRTVTMQFDVQRDTDRDESAPAAAFARWIGAEHSTRLVTQEEFLADLPAIFEAMDQPSIDGVNTWFVSKAAHDAGLKVALSGLGGDEMFGSYPSFRDIPRMLRINAAIRTVPFGERAARLATSKLGRNPKLHSLTTLGDSYAGAYMLKRGLYLPDDLPRLIGAELADEALDQLSLHPRIEAMIDPDPGSAFGRIATLEASIYMRNQLLRDTDWASMAHSLEVRTPLVDAFLLRQLAPVVMEHGSKTKTSLGAVLPEELRERPKTGFSTPLAEWMDLPPDGTSTRMRSWAQTVMERAY